MICCFGFVVFWGFCLGFFACLFFNLNILNGISSDCVSNKEVGKKIPSYFRLCRVIQLL